MFGLAPSSLDVGGRGKTFPATTASHSLNLFIFPQERLRFAPEKSSTATKDKFSQGIFRDATNVSILRIVVSSGEFSRTVDTSHCFALFFLLEDPRAPERAQLECELMRTPIDVCVTHT